MRLRLGADTFISPLRPTNRNSFEAEPFFVKRKGDELCYALEFIAFNIFGLTLLSQPRGRPVLFAVSHL